MWIFYERTVQMLSLTNPDFSCTSIAIALDFFVSDLKRKRYETIKIEHVSQASFGFKKRIAEKDRSRIYQQLNDGL